MSLSRNSSVEDFSSVGLRGLLGRGLLDLGVTFFSVGGSHLGDGGGGGGGEGGIKFGEDNWSPEYSWIVMWKDMGEEERLDSSKEERETSSKFRRSSVRLSIFVWLWGCWSFYDSSKFLFYIVIS